MAALSRLYPATSGLLGRLRGAPSLERAAVSRELLCEEEESVVPPILFREEDWSAITAAHPLSSMEGETARLAGGPRRHTPLWRYELRNALTTPWGVFTLDASFCRAGRADLARLLRAPVAHYEKGFFAARSVSLRYFGHWMSDALPTSLCARPDERLVLPIPSGWIHAEAYAGRLGLNRITDEFAIFDRLSLIDDVGMNSHRRGRIARVWEMMQPLLPPGPAPAGVFIRRGATGDQRITVNEDELAEALAARGFAICGPWDDLDAILAAAARAPVVVTLEGSQWGHALFAAARDALYVSYVEGDRFANTLADYAPALGYRVATHVMRPAPGGWRVDVAAILSLIDEGLAMKAAS